jgi:hypothetical protein
VSPNKQILEVDFLSTPGLCAVHASFSGVTFTVPGGQIFSEPASVVSEFD